MKNLFFVFSFFVIALLISCKEDNIVILKQGTSFFPFATASLKLSSDINTSGFVYVNHNGTFQCDSIRISFDGFVKDYSFTGYTGSDSTIYVNIVPLDSTVASKLKFEAKQEGSSTSGKLYYCSNINNNCAYLEIGHIVGFYSDHYEGFYYSPLFYGEYDVDPTY